MQVPPCARKLVDVLESVFFYMLATIAMHEGFHYTVATLFGYEASIKLVVHGLIWTGGFTCILLPVTAPLWHRIVIALAGGVLTGLMLLWSYAYESDLEDKFIAGLLGWEQLFYGFSEGLLPVSPQLFWQISPVASLIGVAIGLAFFHKTTGKTVADLLRC